VLKPGNVTLRELELPDIGKSPETFWKRRDLRSGVEPVVWRWTRGRPDLSDCIAETLPGRPWLLQLWEPIHTKAPSPARCQPYCCYIATVIFYHRPYISRRGKPWRCNGRWHWIPAPAGFEQYDEVECRLHWDDVVRFEGTDFQIGGGRVIWHGQQWWMARTARRRPPPKLAVAQ